MIKERNIPHTIYFILPSCNESCDAKLDTYDVFFVIEGMMTNEPEPCTVNLSRTNETVLGWYTAAGISKKRIFKEAIKATSINEPFYYRSIRMSQNLHTPSARNTLYITRGEEGQMGAVRENCIFCTADGSTIKTPDFWTD